MTRANPSETQTARVMAAIQANPGITAAEIREKTSLSERTVQDLLARASRSGRVTIIAMTGVTRRGLRSGVALYCLANDSAAVASVMARANEVAVEVADYKARREAAMQNATKERAMRRRASDALIAPPAYMARVMAAITRHPGILTREICEETGLITWVVRRVLDQARRAGLVAVTTVPLAVQNSQFFARSLWCVASDEAAARVAKERATAFLRERSDVFARREAARQARAKEAALREIRLALEAPDARTALKDEMDAFAEQARAQGAGNHDAGTGLMAVNL